MRMSLLLFWSSSLLGPYFNEIYLMPDKPELEKVNKALKDHSDATTRCGIENIICIICLYMYILLVLQLA